MQRITHFEFPQSMNALMKKGAALAAMLALVGGMTAAEQGQAAVGQWGSNVWSQDPSTKCRFVMPRSLPSGPTYWTGACPGGKASGLGMLRRRDGGQSGEVFFGELRDGVPTLGVIDTSRGNEGGYIAGRFLDGDLGQGEVKWQDRADAFNVAASAARAVSSRFRAQKNPASARFYERQAKLLESQIE
jgi:hypothetical protein